MRHEGLARRVYQSSRVTSTPCSSVLAHELRASATDGAPGNGHEEVRRTLVLQGDTFAVLYAGEGYMNYVRPNEDTWLHLYLFLEETA